MAKPFLMAPGSGDRVPLIAFLRLFRAADRFWLCGKIGAVLAMLLRQAERLDSRFGNSAIHEIES